MENKQIRDRIAQYAQDAGFDEGIILLDNPHFDNSILGVNTEGRVIYDYESMVQEMMADDKCSEEDAREFIDYNTMRAIHYMGEGRPIIMMISREQLMALYSPSKVELKK